MNIASMVARLAAVGNTNNYVVWGILNGTNEGVGTATYNVITNFNGLLKSVYGPHYFDAHQALVFHFNPNVPQDVIDAANDVIPYSLRSQQAVYPWVHPNTLGNIVLANALANSCLNNWNSKIPTLGSVQQNIGLAFANAPILNNAWLRGTTTTTNLNASTIYVNDIYPSPPAVEQLPQQSYGNAVKLHSQLALSGAGNELALEDLANLGVSSYGYLQYSNTSFNFISPADRAQWIATFVNPQPGNYAYNTLFFHPKLNPGNFAFPVAMGVGESTYDAIFWQFNYVGPGSLMNSFGIDWFGVAQGQQWFANGNSSSPYNQTNATFIATAALGGFQGNGSGLSDLNAAQLAGIIPQSTLPGFVVTNNNSTPVTLAGGLTVTAGVLSGNGGSLTNLSYKNNFDSQTAAIIGNAVTNPGCVWLYTGGSNICFGSGFQAFSNACAAVNPADSPVDSVYVGPGTWNYYPTFTFPVNIYGAGAGQWDKRNSMFTGGTIITNTGGGTTTFYCGYSNSVFCNLAVEGTG
jgi:hypothetical protein